MSQDQHSPREGQMHGRETSPGATSSGLGETTQLLQTRQSRPSDDNQRHSNKVESIEVLIHPQTDFLPKQTSNGGSGQRQQQQPLGPEQSAFSDTIFGHKGDDQMQDSIQDDAQMQVQYLQTLCQRHPSLHMQQPWQAQEVKDEMMQGLSDVSMPSMQEYGGIIASARALHSDHLAEYDKYAAGASSVFGHQDHAKTVQHRHQIHSDSVVDEIGGEVGFAGGQALFAESETQQDAGMMATDSAQNDKRFYSLAELVEMEPMFERKFYYDSCGSYTLNSHVILSPQEYRAKLYWLDNENRWKDIGTGRFRLLLSKDGEEHYIQVVSEDCIDEQMPIEDVVDKVIDGGNGSDGNSASPKGASHHLSTSPSKQVFLHRCFVHCLHDFSRQGDTIITWSDDYKNEFALSFQDEKGAQNTWWSICFLKGIQINSNFDEPNEAGGSSESNSITGNSFVLPTKENLADLVQELFSTDAYTRRNIAEAVLKQEENNMQRNTNGSSELSDQDHSKLQSWRSLYLDELQKIFNGVEQQFHKATKAMEENEGDEHDRCIHMTQQVNNLHSLFQIFRNLLNLNHSELLEVLLNENYWLTTFGALEYDPEVFMPMAYKFDGGSSGSRSPVGQHKLAPPSLTSSPNSVARSYGSYDHFEQNQLYSASLSQEAGFREFLQNKVKFKQAVEIRDPQVNYSIHLGYKLQYLKDTAMARFIDENTSHTIMQLVSSLHNIILDYIFGDDFERIQAELISKMNDNSNVQDKENALKFFLEICSLLKSTNLTNRQLQNCTNAFTKIMMVLAQIFDVMLPDRQTLLAEVAGDKTELIKIFEARSKKDQERALAVWAATGVAKEASAKADTSTHELVPLEESKDSALAAPKNEQMDKGTGGLIHTAHDKAGGGPLAPAEGQAAQEKQDSVINPGRGTLEEYLKNPQHSEDPKMTQIDILKSNSIEIFYNLLILLNNVNHSTIRDFLCSEHQKRQNYVFLRHLAQHMMYSSQQGIKVSICEFFKDLTSKETTEMQKNFQQVILNKVVALFVDFLAEDDYVRGGSGASLELKKQESNGNDNDDMEMKDEEELKSQESRQAVDPRVALAFKKQIDQSRILILQFLNKLIVDNVDSFQLRQFFMTNKVLMKVADCSLFKSNQTNVEVVKFFKAIIQAKDSISVSYMIKKQIFETILEIFLQNKTKGNMLHSCILNLFEMLTPAEAVSTAAGTSSIFLGLDNCYGAPKTEGGYVQLNLLNKLYQRLYDNGYVKRVFLHKLYEGDFRKFNRYLRQVLDIQQSEHDSKQASDRDRSNSQSQPRFVYESRPRIPSVPGSWEEKETPTDNQDMMEDVLEKMCFPKELPVPHEKVFEVATGVPDDAARSELVSIKQEKRKDDGDGGEEKNEKAATETAEERKAMVGNAISRKNQAPDDVTMQSKDEKEISVAEELADSKQKQFLKLPERKVSSEAGGVSGGGSHSNRAARSMSPMSGHGLEVHRTHTIPSVARKSNILDVVEGSGQIGSPQQLTRRMSQEELQPLDLHRQGSGTSNKMQNLSDEANAQNKSAFSDQLSNPDLDEIFFNKLTPSPLGGFAFQAQQSSAAAGSVLKLHAQKSPIDGISAQEFQLEKHYPLKKSSSGSSTGKKLEFPKPKFERGRRACSENPPTRTELNLTVEEVGAQAKPQETEEVLQRLLDSKLGQKEAATMRTFEMRRNDSIGPGGFSSCAGLKRTHQEGVEWSDSDEEDDVNVKENVASKRPRLSDEWQNKKEAHANAVMTEQDESEALNDLLDASLGLKSQNIAGKDQ